MKRRAALLCLVCASLLLATGSAAFTTTEADRSVEVRVVDDSNAYLAFGESLQCGSGGGNGDNQNVVRNQFPESIQSLTLRFTVKGESGALKIGKRGSTERLETGESKTIRFTQISPGSGVTVQITSPGKGKEVADNVSVTVIKAIGEGVEVSTDERHFEVSCTQTASGGTENGENQQENGDE